MTTPPTQPHPATYPATYPATVEGIAAALAALGDTPDRVAETLLRAGHSGTPGSCDTCPIAHYLHAVVPGLTWVAVSEDEVEVTAASGRLFVDMPPGPAAFITAFDTGGAYDQLHPCCAATGPCPCPLCPPPSGAGNG